MTDEPDMRFCIDALFDHLVNNLGHKLTDEQDWTFLLRSENVKQLEAVGYKLADEFIVRIQDAVEEVDLDGKSVFGPPMLSVIKRAALNEAEVKALEKRIRLIAQENGFAYEGVECYEPVDEEELVGWLPLEDAAWRLQHMSDCGLEPNAPLPWTFAIQTPDRDSTLRLAEELAREGFDDRDDYDEPDEVGCFGHCVFVAGRNNEAEMMAAVAKIERIVERHSGVLEGIQFYTREEAEEVFGA